MSKKEKNNNQLVKRYSIATEEKEKIQSIQSVMGIHALEREAMLDKMYMTIARIKNRMDIKYEAPEGYTRSADIDTETWEIVVTDTKIDEKSVKEENEAKN